MEESSVKHSGLDLITNIEKPFIVNEVSEGSIEIRSGKVSMVFSKMGDILLNGRVLENDKDIVKGLREFLRYDKTEQQKVISSLQDKINACPTCRSL